LKNILWKLFLQNILPKMKIILFLFSAIVALVVAPPPPYSDHCIVGEQDLYPPPVTKPIPWYTINLDDPPETRWNEVSKAYATNITTLIGVIKEVVGALFGPKLIEWVDSDMGAWDKKLPEPYATEIASIANITGINLGEIVLYNIFYEVFTVCTSIVAQDNNDKLYHARNLDFGLFLGWDVKTNDWAVTEKLRDIIININWTRGGQTVYKSVNFAGYIGIYNGVKQNGFTITANERFGLNGGYLGIIQWLMDNSTASLMSLLVRETFETVDNYQDAVMKLSTTPIMAPVYYIVGGKNSGEGSIIVRARSGVDGVTNLNLTDTNGWYVLETNYDPWKKPLYLDDRRTPGNICMQRLTRDNVGFAGIFNVLSSPTNFNKLTAYTVLMQVDTGTLETYIQKCPDPCWAW
jgi:acid ceramidase